MLVVTGKDTHTHIDRQNPAFRNIKSIGVHCLFLIYFELCSFFENFLLQAATIKVGIIVKSNVIRKSI